jgi:hypothetical protein
MMNKVEKPHLHKADVMCRIFKVAGWLDQKGFDKRIHEIEVTETDKSFVGDGKRISKAKLMNIDTMFVENHKSMRYYTYCRYGEQQKALDMIKEHIIDKVKTYKSEIDALMQFVL